MNRQFTLTAILLLSLVATGCGTQSPYDDSSSGSSSYSGGSDFGYGDNQYSVPWTISITVKDNRRNEPISDAYVCYQNVCSTNLQCDSCSYEYGYTDEYGELTLTQNFSSYGDCQVSLYVSAGGYIARCVGSTISVDGYHHTVFLDRE